MKFLFYKVLFIITITVTVVSCKKDDGDNPADPKAENRKALGVSAENILSADIYDRLTVEFVYAAGFRPQEETIFGFKTFIENRINKPEGIIFTETVIDAPENAPFNTQEIREIEDANRTKYNEGSNIALYIFFANGSSENDTNTSVTLGSAYRNTSMIVYEKTLIDLANRTANPTEALLFLESNTIKHEFGHILGLVNIQNDDIHSADHEDTSNSKHCIVEECLMYFESRNPFLILDRFSDLQRTGSVPVFDDLCTADLQAKGGR